MKNSLFTTFLILISLFSAAQETKPTKTRSTLQKEFINKKFIRQQKVPVKINGNETIDSLFHTIESAWKSVAPDTLKKYKIDMLPAEFDNFDAYNYLWLLTSMTQNLEIVDQFGEYLINNYMLPALQRDFELIKRNPILSNIKIMDAGSLGNTLAIGSSSLYAKKTFLSVYKAYVDFNELVQSLPKTDTTVTNYANGQLKSISRFYYDFNARNNFYNSNPEMAYNYLITGLNINDYPIGRAISFSKVLIKNFSAAGDQDKCFAILNTLAINTTADNLDRDTLRNQYLKVNPQKGKMMYDNLQAKLTISAFKKSKLTIQLPEKWETLNVKVDLDKVKYVLIDFWYTSCGPCLAEIPELNKFYEKLKNRADVLFLSVNTDYFNGKMTEDHVKDSIKKLGINFPVLYDNATKSLSKQLSISAYPSKVIINTQGDVIIKTDNSPITLESFETLIKEIK